MRFVVATVLGVSVLLCAPASCDIISEDFSTNPSWRVDAESDPADVFESFGNATWDSGGYLEEGYEDFPVGVYVFADYGSSGGSGAVAGNKDYTYLPYLSIDLKFNDPTDGSMPACCFFFATNNDPEDYSLSSGSDGSRIYYYNSYPTLSETTWTTYTASLASSSGWVIHRSGGITETSWSDYVADIDAIGILFYDGYPTAPEGAVTQIDNFTATPEPSLLLTMAPLAGFLGWRLRRSKGNRVLRT